MQQLDVNEVKLFLSESNRVREEKFLRGITDNYDNKLIFSKNTCTDGNLVQVFPNHPHICNLKAVKKIMELLDVQLNSTWLLLKVFSRGGIAHEAFHILFTDFRSLERMEREFKNEHPYKLKSMHNIMNIGEDSFIELAGINYLPGLEFPVTFGNELAFENTPSLEEIEKKCKSKELPWINLFLHWAMLYAIMGKLKGNIKNRKIKNRIKKAAPIFDKIRYEKICDKRYEMAKQIYYMVEDLIEEAIEDFNMPDFDYFKNPNMPKLKEALDTDVDIKKDFDSRGVQSSSSQNQQSGEEKDQDQDGQDNSNGNDSSNEEKKDKDDKDKQGAGKGKKDDSEKDKDGQDNGGDGGQDSDSDKSDKNDPSQQNGNAKQNGKDDDNEGANRRKDSIDIDEGANDTDADPQDEEDDAEVSKEDDAKKKQEELEKLLKELEAEKNSVEQDEDVRQKMEQREKELEMKQQRELSKVQYSQLHHNIRIEINKKFPIIANQEDIYERLYNRHRGIIQRFANMLKKLIQNQNDSWRTKQVIGAQLDTRRMADHKRRVWKRKNDRREVADLSIQLLIDGSGSMHGKVYEVIQATIILYEVAKKLDIPISIIEERAIYGSPKVVHNVLVDYRNYRSQNTKYNLLHLTASGGTREGVSLKWASTYQNLQPNKDKLLIVLADGNPEHSYAGQSYTGRTSASDTRMVAEQIEKSGTSIVAISLGENCYPYLKQIYNNTILCDDLTKLPDQMLRILKRNMFKN